MISVRIANREISSALIRIGRTVLSSTPCAFGGFEIWSPVDIRDLERETVREITSLLYETRDGSAPTTGDSVTESAVTQLWDEAYIVLSQFFPELNININDVTIIDRALHLQIVASEVTCKY